MKGLSIVLAGFITGKYLAINLNNPSKFSVFLVIYLALILLRLLSWLALGKKFQLSYIYPVLSLNYFFSFTFFAFSSFLSALTTSTFGALSTSSTMAISAASPCLTPRRYILV